jgi:transcription initiation factor TFIIH subunit 4
MSTLAETSSKPPTPPDKLKLQATSNNTNTTGVLDYLRSVLPWKSLQELYVEESRGPFVCRAVLQQLSQTGQQIVMRLQCTGGSFPAQGVRVWTNLSPSKYLALLKELHGWAILQDFEMNDATNNLISLTPTFLKGLRATLRCLDSSPWRNLELTDIRALEVEAGIMSPSNDVTTEDLERYTQQQWDAVLHFLVGSVGHTEPPPAMVHFLLQTGLMQADPDYRGTDPDEAPLVITESGYDFMLQDNHQQVWHFVVQYLRSVVNGEELRNEALLLLICLSFAEVGGAYLASSLNKNSRAMIKHFSHFGLIYTRKIGKVTLFYPTRAAMHIAGTTSRDSNTSRSQTSTVWSLSNKAVEAALADPRPKESSHLAIIVQTNFQLCAYTTSELHVSMLGLFCQVSTIRRMPNVVFMHITRDSVKGAFSLGIQARQILRFLEKHAHPKLRGPNNLEPIPSNVVDQIWLWDRELSRVVFSKVYTHDCLMGAAEYRAVQQYAREKGALAYCSDRRQQLLLDYAQMERIQAFAQQWRAQAVTRDT